ncbi:hypothetical protein L950_0222895 [Sphingobacterium sp. IITKGP-BTPF85]|nr:hypothetical protein L950_0222895 [Sphingobacterium sp. IITKGP-BTPF85]
MANQPEMSSNKNVWIIILVASLGYFVDIYDLIIFSIVRVKSFEEIGVSPADMRSEGEFVLNMQMGGLLIGGVIWGIIGDKFGRLKSCLVRFCCIHWRTYRMVLYMM